MAAASLIRFIIMPMGSAQQALSSWAGNFNLGSNIVVDGGESVRGVQRAFYARIRPEWFPQGE